MKKVVVTGEILVEVMADTVGDGFLSPQPLTGPFPSGAPAIFIDQVARLGQPCAIISAVGNDDFGRLNLKRLHSDGVDVSGVAVDAELPTGTAFVRYRSDGSRDFVFNIRHSAAGRPPSTAAAQVVLDGAGHFHVMGSSLASPDFVRINMATAEAVKSRGGTVSFDPNVRKEMLGAAGLRDAMGRILALTDLYLPSGDELTLLTTSKDPEGAEDELLRLGVRAIVHKRGAQGVGYRDARTRLTVAGFRVTEVDPTGAGDCFGGAFTTFWLRGLETEEALTLAAAAGALAVTRRGPMEGASDLETIRSFVTSQRKAAQ